jgi:hypothetical protein
MTMTRDQSCPINLLATHEIYVEGNMETIVETVSINISRNPGVVENVFVGADCSPEEIQIYTNLFKEFCNVFSSSYEEMPGMLSLKFRLHMATRTQHQQNSNEVTHGTELISQHSRRAKNYTK